MKRKLAEKGYTILELVAVIVIVATLAAVVAGRFQSAKPFQTMAARDDIVAGLFYAQQIAMARGGGGNPVQFVSSGTAIDVRESGNSLGGIYPLALPQGFTLTAITLNYDKLGRTAATSLTLSDGDNSAAIEVSGAGFAR